MVFETAQAKWSAVVRELTGTCSTLYRADVCHLCCGSESSDKFELLAAADALVEGFYLLLSPWPGCSTFFSFFVGDNGDNPHAALQHSLLGVVCCRVPLHGKYRHSEIVLRLGQHQTDSQRKSRPFSAGYSFVARRILFFEYGRKKMRELGCMSEREWGEEGSCSFFWEQEQSTTLNDLISSLEKVVEAMKSSTTEVGESGGSDPESLL